MTDAVSANLLNIFLLAYEAEVLGDDNDDDLGDEDLDDDDLGDEDLDDEDLDDDDLGDDRTEDFILITVKNFILRMNTG